MTAPSRVLPSGFVAAALVLGACGGSLVLGACGGSDALREGTAPTDPVAEVSANELFATGMSSASQGDYLRAEQYLAASGARGYDETKVIGPLVRVCVAASRLRQALVYAQPYLRTHPDDWRLRFVVATIHLGLERNAEARAELERVISSAPDAPEPQFVLGTLLRERLRDESAAKPYFERYLALAPEGGHADEARVALSTPLPPIEIPTPTPGASTDATPDSHTPAVMPAPATTPLATHPAATPAAPTRTVPVRLPQRTDAPPPTVTGTP